MGNAVSVKAADEREAQRRQERRQKRKRRQQRRLLKLKPKFDKSGNPLHYDNQGNQFYYDSKGNPFYVDETGTHFYLDDHGEPFYLGEIGEPYYLDENREKFYLDENREPYYLDKKGQKYFLDTKGKKYYFDENDNPFFAGSKSDKYIGDASNLSDKLLSAGLNGNALQIQIHSPKTPYRNDTPHTQRTLQAVHHREPINHHEDASINDKNMQICSPVTPLDVEIAESQWTAPVIDHRNDSSGSYCYTPQKFAESVKTDTESVNTESILSSYSSLSFTKSEFEQEIANTPDYIKDDTKESETRRTAQIEAENKILRKLLVRERNRETLPAPKSFRKVGNYNIKLQDDTKDCEIVGQAFLPDGNLVIADLSNRKLKLFDSELELSTSYTVDYIPQGLCSGAKDNMVHMTFKTRMFNGIDIFKVDDKSISPQQTVKIKGIPYGIARSNEGLAVIISNPNSWQIHLMNLKGKISRVIELENNDLKLTNPEYITITKELRLFITDRGSNSVCCVNTNGKEIFQYRQLRAPKGICIDNKGSVYIASPGVVHQISTSGERIKALMRRETSGFAPCGVCYDSEDSLMVLTGQSNTLAAYQLKE